ncbi:sodium- and chloride-dependent glycine transporter 1-like [Condylostylus longicornis]|uniref:sodium- and chloride-dependent glycine transporter 1-like n=1 Tax=Condylostylus longicornis TaxID=2530218 RepID=UPI00244E19F7|nr:sodium- and chloride-dependent glycine transporter 1-like [Condylostylus longicornis]
MSGKENSILSNGSRRSVNSNGSVVKTTTPISSKPSLITLNKGNSIEQNGKSTSVPDGTTIIDGENRGNWQNPIEFILACIGYAVGLGNVWRFPYLVYRNGGGAFLVPYLLMVFVIGLPIFLAELYIGQYSGLGPIKAYHYMSPFFQGLGYCTLIVITFVTIYYMVIIAWILFYFFASFTSVLPWGYCNNDFNSYQCYSSLEDNFCKQNNTGDKMDQLFYRKNCTTIDNICREKNFIGHNASYCFNEFNSTLIPLKDVAKRVLASEEYYYRYVLGINDDTDWTNWGYPRWQLVLCLLLGWLIAFFCLIKGIQSAGKVVYFTALFPYVMLTALLVRGATLPGALDGITFYIQPDWNTLLSAAVWGDAASQIFYSFGLACGSLVAFSSYNKFNNNFHTDAVVVSFTNVFTCVFAGFTVFAVLGFMAHNLETTVGDVVQSGPGLAFIAYPEAVLLMPIAPLWAILFFLMMFVLGIGSQFGGIEAICTSLVDHWPHLRNQRWKVTAGVCLGCFVAALPMVCNGGIYAFTLMEWHTASWAILLLGTAEVVIISWVYGMDRALNNFIDMGIKFNCLVRYYWKCVLVVLTPIASVVVFVFTMTEIKPTEFRDYKFPGWADALGWMIGASTLAPFPIAIIYRLFNSKLRQEPWFKPTINWGPQSTNTMNSSDSNEKKSNEGCDNKAFDCNI